MWQHRSLLSLWCRFWKYCLTKKMLEGAMKPQALVRSGFLWKCWRNGKMELKFHPYFVWLQGFNLHENKVWLLSYCFSPELAFPLTEQRRERTGVYLPLSAAKSSLGILIHISTFLQHHSNPSHLTFRTSDKNGRSL